MPESINIKFFNPQNPREFVEPYEGQNLQTIAGRHLPEHGGFTIAVDGRIVEPANLAVTIPGPGAEIQFIPDFGAGVFAFIAAWAAATIGIPASATIPMATIIGSTVFYAGAAFLINSLMPKPELPKVAGGGSPAYSWDPKTTQQEGLPIPRHYGTFRAHGNIIACHTEPSTDGRRQLIYALIAFAEGPIATNDAANVELDGQLMGNFSGVTCETRRGLLTQTATTNYDMTRLQFRVNHKITYAGGSWTYTLPDDDYDDIEIDMRFDLWYRHASGQAGGASAQIKIEVDTADGSSWTTIVNETITDTVQDIYWKKYIVDDGLGYTIARGTRYKLRFSRVDDGDVDEGDAGFSRTHNRFWVESIKEVLDMAFTYPGMATAEIAGVATEEFSGVMDVSALLEYRVLNTYNGAAWSLADDSDDPAWALWDLFTLPVISGDGSGTAYAIEEYLGFETAKLEASDFYALSQHADDSVPDAEGGTEKRFTCNGIVDAEKNMWSAAMKVCEMARCLPVWDGNIIGLAINKSKTRAGILSVGNILEGSFEESFAPQIDAASEIEAVFHDVDRDYERRTLPFANTNLTNEQNKVSLNLWGLVKMTEVVRHIKFRLRQTELRRRTIVASGDIDALTYEVGDLIGVQEDVPDWNDLGNRGGGRIEGFETGATNDIVTLDRDVENDLDGGSTYELAVRVADAEAPTIKTVLSARKNKVTISGHYTGTDPARGDLWALGKQNLVLKDFTVEAIEQTGRLQRKLTLLEYDGDCYTSDSETPVVPVPAATAARTDRRIVKAASIRDLRIQAAAAALEFPTVDVPLWQNITWNDDTPSGGSISWSATDGSDPLLFHWKGTVYEITASNTSDTYVYFDTGFTTAFQTTNTLSTAFGANKVLIAVNNDGTAEIFQGMNSIHTDIIRDGAVSAQSNAHTSGQIQLTPVSTEVTVQTVTVTTSGQDVVLFFGAEVWSAGTPKYLMRIYVDGTTYPDDLVQSIGYVAVASNSRSLLFASCDDSPAAGSHTYYFRLAADVDNGTYARSRQLTAMELKK